MIDQISLSSAWRNYPCEPGDFLWPANTSEGAVNADREAPLDESAMVLQVHPFQQLLARVLFPLPSTHLIHNNKQGMTTFECLNFPENTFHGVSGKKLPRFCWLFLIKKVKMSGLFSSMINQKALNRVVSAINVKNWSWNYHLYIKNFLRHLYYWLRKLTRRRKIKR